MRSFIAVGATVAATLTGFVMADTVMIEGNYYSTPVQAIAYHGIPGVGAYDKVTSMQSNTQCTKESKGYSGSLAPLDEELSAHFRGPLKLKQFAYYTLSSKKRSPRATLQNRRHGHQHFHEHNKEIRDIQELEEEKRAVGDIVTVTMDGKVQQWTNAYAGAGPATPAPVAPSVDEPKADEPKENKPSAVKPPSSAAAVDAGKGDWARQAYYNAADGTAEGLTFLTATYSESTPKVPTDKYTAVGSKTPQVLDDCLIEDDLELVIMSDKPCEGDDCGVLGPNYSGQNEMFTGPNPSQNGWQAYHGFAGANKVFLAEFSMPLSGKTNATHPDLVAPDMSAFWFLNSEIDRTVQYGPCSCWPACGELDVFEILNSGNTRATTYLHMAPYGGSPHYFNRPTDGTVKVAVIFHNDIVHIQVLDDSTNFDAVVSGSTVSGWLKQECAIINPTGDVAH